MSESNLEDRAAIHDLFTRYCCALDNGEIETVVDCFTVDAILKSPVIDISGHDEIRAFAGRFAAQRTAGTQFRHMVSNIAMTITGNRAPASAHLLVLISKDGDHRSLPPGRYVCELIKKDSGQCASRAAPSFMTKTTRSTGSVAKLAGQAEDHLSRLRSHQQGLLRRRSGQS